MILFLKIKKIFQMGSNTIKNILDKFRIADKVILIDNKKINELRKILKKINLFFHIIVYRFTFLIMHSIF